MARPGRLWHLAGRVLALCLGLAVPVLAGIASPAAAQVPDLSMGQPDLARSPVLTVDPERLFSGTRFGQRIAAELRADQVALAAENRRIEEDLAAEEQSLTERRPTMAPEAFRAEAEAFDEKVQEIRRARDAREIEVEQSFVAAREAYFAEIRPVLGRLMLDRGAVVILDRRSVFLAVGLVDLTEEAIAVIDAEFGDGAEEAVPETPETPEAPDGGLQEPPAGEP